MQLTLGRKKAPKHHSACPQYGNRHVRSHECDYCRRLKAPKPRYYAVADDLLGER